MREPPSQITAEALHAALRDAYGLDAAELSFLPLGHDSSAWVYAVRDAAGARRFLKLRAGALNEPSLRVPHLLHSSGVPGVVAPLPTLAGTLAAPAPPYALILYPFVDGPTGMDAGLSDAQWSAYGAALRQVHAVAPSAEVAATLRRETYAPPGADAIRRVDATLARGAPDDPVAAALAPLWRERREAILALVERAEALGAGLARRGLPHVICHADIHTGNVLRDGDERVWLVDWDEVVLAPKERDLMFAVGGISAQLVSPRQSELFLQGYGPAPIDREALAYYRHAWAVSDIGSFSADALFRDDLGPTTRATFVEMLRRLFTPGEIVSIARGEQLG